MQGFIIYGYWMITKSNLGVIINLQIDVYPWKILKIEQHGRYFPDDISRCNLLQEEFSLLIEILLKFVPIDNNTAPFR